MSVIEHHCRTLVEIFRNLRTQMNFFVDTTDSVRALMFCDKNLLTNRRARPPGKFFHLFDKVTAYHYFLAGTISQFSSKSTSF